MSNKLLEKLSNADSVASHESEVRKIIKEELSYYSSSFKYDGIGSLIVTKQSKVKDAPTIMFAAHMDEVGYMIRSVSEIGMAYLTKLGNVEGRTEEMQLVRAKKENGEKVEGILNVERNDRNEVEQRYVDFGFSTSQEFYEAGLNIGNIVCFASDYRELAADNIVCGKAFDDRVGCYSLIEAMKALEKVELDVNVVAAFTSSEEVGTRGGRLTAKIVNPDVFFAVDVAKHPELDRGFKDHRKLGQGPMIEFYDKTMVPNPNVLKFVCNLADNKHLSYQRDMFRGGGTDAGTAHLENDGITSLVLGLPLRYCHDSYSLANEEDLESLAVLIEEISKNISQNVIQEFYEF